VMHLKQVVVEGATATDLTKGPGLVRGGSLPGEPGTAVIAGRRATYSAPFSTLDQLVVGDTIHVVAGDGKSTYRVTRTWTTSGDRLGVVRPARGNRLLLVTAGSSFLPADQFVVESTLVGRATPLAPRVAGRRAGHTVPFVRLDFGGDTVAGWLTAVWAVAFIAVVVGTAYAVRRWRRPALTYRLSVPILLACLLLACECLSRWLPGTL
jgi:sortase A